MSWFALEEEVISESQNERKSLLSVPPVPTLYGVASCSRVRCTYKGVGVVVYQEARQQKLLVVFWTWESGKG